MAVDENRSAKVLLFFETSKEMMKKIGKGEKAVIISEYAKNMQKFEKYAEI